MRFASTLLVCTAPLLGACATYEARPLVPEDELEALRVASLDDLQVTYAEPGRPAELAPRRFDPSDGLSESELVVVALTQNPTLRAKRWEIGEARALLVSAGLLPNPDLGAFVRPGIDGAGGTNLEFDLLFGLLRPDERPAREAGADARVEVARAEIAAEEMQLAAAVRRARVGVLSSEQSVRLFQQELEVRAAAAELVREQRRLGEATEIAVALVEMDRASVQRQLRAADAAASSARRDLNALLGIPPTAVLPSIGSGTDLVFTIVEDVSDEQIDARLLASHPGVRAREAEYRAAEQDLRLAVARQSPRVALGPSYEKDVEGAESLGLGLSIELPLFDRNQGEIEEKREARERRRDEYRAELQTLRAHAIDAREDARRAREQVEADQRDVAPLVERTESLFEGALRARDVSVFEWLAARSRAIQARRDQLDALVQYAIAIVDLDAATGSPIVAVVTRESGRGSAGTNP